MIDKPPLRIGTRGSPLALAQANDVRDRLCAADPALAGFMKALGQDAEGELYAVTGNSTPSGLRGRVWKIVAATGGRHADLGGDGDVGNSDR